MVLNASASSYVKYGLSEPEQVIHFNIVTKEKKIYILFPDHISERGIPSAFMYTPTLQLTAIMAIIQYHRSRAFQ